jgi:hypothetical protein
MTNASTAQAGRLITLVLLGLTLASLNIRPAGELDLVVLGSPLRIAFSGATLIAFLLVGLTCAGVEAMVRTHRWLADAPLAYTTIFWVLPAVVTLAAAFLVPALFGGLGWLVGLLATLLGLAVVLLAQYAAIDPDTRYYDRARLLLTLTAYGAAFLVYLAVSAARVRSLVSASAILVVSILLALTLLRGAADEWRRAWVYALVCGIVVGELTWALNYWPLRSVGTAALLLLAFYVLTGLAQQALAGRVQRRVLVEFAVFGGVMFFVILRLSQWLG